MAPRRVPFGLLLLALASLPARAADAAASAAAGPQAEARLIGAWQVDPPTRGTAAPGPRGQQAGYLGGSVLRFRPDHTLSTFPGCVADRESLLRATESATQTWRVTDDLMLAFKAERGSESYENGAPIELDARRLVIVTPNAPKTTMSRYDGPLPPDCD